MNYYENTNDLFLDGEIWKDINGFEDYQVSNFGRVKSLKLKNIQILKLKNNGKGYLLTRLYKDGKENSKLIHILVYETFNNYKLRLDECIHHIDENKLDNLICNLKVMNKFEHKSFHNKNKIVSEKTRQKMSNSKLGMNNPNFKKIYSKETISKISNNTMGQNNNQAKLMENDIIEIFKDLNNGLTQKEIAKKFCVHVTTISKIKNRDTWSHIKLNKF